MPLDIAIAHGDGVGPEIMAAVLHIFEAAGVPVTPHPVIVGEQAYLQGHANGIAPQDWELLLSTPAFLKAPITTPQGGGFRSLNVTIRMALGLFANVRPCIAYHPFVHTKHPDMDLVIVRENEEDLYVGTEYQQTAQTTHAIKIITAPACERIIRYAFEYAVAHKRKKVTCFTKDNILKITDGLFHRTYEAIANEYPQIAKEHWIVDIGAAKLADHPEQFDVIVLPNLYGDILSDVAAQIAGSVGLAGSANIGTHHAMFEAIHGSAPRRANQNLANPSGLLLAGLMMLEHLNLPEHAARIHNAWLTTIEEGIHTYDIFTEGQSRQKVGTREFASAVVERLGRIPTTFTTRPQGIAHAAQGLSVQPRTHKLLVGADITIDSLATLQEIQTAAEQAAATLPLKLDAIYNRGARLWPGHWPHIHCSDAWRLRFLCHKESIHATELLELQRRLLHAHLDVIRIEHLYRFGDHPGYSEAE